MNRSNSTEPNTERRWSSQNRIAALCTTLSIIAVSTTVSNKTSTPYLLRLPDVFKSKAVRRALNREIVTPNDIKVPADMWRRPSDFPSLNPVPLPNCCNDPRTREKTETHTAKFLCGCSSKEVSIRYYGPSMGYTPDDLKHALSEAGGDLIMIGDSLTRQWFESLSCYLGAFDSWHGFTVPPIESNRDGLEADITESFMRFRLKWRKRGNIGTINKSISSWGEFAMPSTMRGAPRQRVMFQQVNDLSMVEMMDLFTYYDTRYPHDFERKRPIFVINFGVHYNRPRHYNMVEEEKGESALRRDLGMIVHFCHKFGARCIFRETSPQHFVNSGNDGLFPASRRGTPCMLNPPESFDTLSRWRNDVLHDVIGEVGSGDKPGAFLRVMPLFDKLVGLTNEHHRIDGDCTHYKMDPELWEPWHVSLTEVLRDVVTKVGR